jgi:anti-sigma B factor antagonist
LTAGRKPDSVGGQFRLSSQGVAWQTTEDRVEITRRDLEPGVVVLELHGPLQMGVECKRLELAVDDLLKEKKTRVVLDLSRVSKVDSGGVGKIVNCLSRLRVAGGTLCLAGVTGMIGGVLKLTQVDRLVKIYPTALEAAQNFPQVSPPSNRF